MKWCGKIGIKTVDVAQDWSSWNRDHTMGFEVPRLLHASGQNIDWDWRFQLRDYIIGGEVPRHF